MPASVLVVDRDLATRDMLREFLELEGFAVSCERDEAAAWGAIQRERFAVVVLEASPVGVFGTGLLRALDRDRPEVPVVPMTSDTIDQSGLSRPGSLARLRHDHAWVVIADAPECHRVGHLVGQNGQVRGQSPSPVNRDGKRT